MKAPAISKSRNAPRARCERGVTMVLVALAMVAIIAMAALSIDVISLYLVKEEAQRAADAGALAAARVISISGITGDPNNSTASWQPICGGLDRAATQAAIATASQNVVAGSIATTVHVSYSAGGVSVPNNCVALAGGPFGVNPLVTVQVVRAGVPSFFSRIWGNTGNSVSATATAEAFNPSASDINTNGGVTGSVTPVHPSCVKPWMVPNLDPGNPAGCTGATCLPFVALGNGAIQNPGISNTSGVIAETFNLFADCAAGSSCGPPLDNPPVVDSTTAGAIVTPPQSLEYLPGLVQNSSVAVPTCSVGTGANPDYWPAVAGCDQSTVYQCGVQSSIASPANQIDLTENPGGAAGDTASAISCLINQPTLGSASGQDLLNASAYPYQITAGPLNAISGVRGNPITSSNSIVSLPIYDSSGGALTFTGNQANVTIVGFLQVFINQVNTDGSLNVTVLNVAGCGNNATNAPIPGTSPVPVRLVTPP
jgi:Flp pilus assembly protein TadG